MEIFLDLDCALNCSHFFISDIPHYRDLRKNQLLLDYKELNESSIIEQDDK